MIEFEKVQTIRKRARTQLADCRGCGEERDVVSLTEAATLFETEHEDLFKFIRQNNCHYHISDNSNIYLCVASLIEQMRRRHLTDRLTA